MWLRRPVGGTLKVCLGQLHVDRFCVCVCGMYRVLQVHEKTWAVPAQPFHDERFQQAHSVEQVGRRHSYLVSGPHLDLWAGFLQPQNVCAASRKSHVTLRAVMRWVLPMDVYTDGHGFAVCCPQAFEAVVDAQPCFNHAVLGVVGVANVTSWPFSPFFWLRQTHVRCVAFAGVSLQVSV